MKKNQRGFGALLVLVVLFVVICVGGIAYLLTKNDDKKNTDASQNPSTSQNETPNNQQNNQPSTAKQNYELKEWDLKIDLRDYDKVTFEIKNESGILTGTDPYEAVATPSFKSEFLQDKTCEPGVSLYRSKAKFPSLESKKIGDYYYVVTGSPGYCTDNPNNPDDQLKARFLQDFRIDNISAL